MNPTVNLDPNAHSQSITPEQLDALIAHREQGIAVRKRMAECLRYLGSTLQDETGPDYILLAAALSNVADAWAASEEFGLSELEAETEGWRQLRRSLSSGIIVPQFAGVRKQ